MPEPKKSLPARLLPVLIALFGLIFVAGLTRPYCYERISEGSVATYQYVWWVGPTVIAVGLLAIPIGLLLRIVSNSCCFVAIGMSSILLLVIAPSIFNDYTIIDDDHFEVVSGLWFAPIERSIQFQDLSEIRYVKFRSYGRRSRTRTATEIHFIPMKGEPFVVPAFGPVTNSLPEILSRAKAKGVKVVNPVP